MTSLYGRSSVSTLAVNDLFQERADAVAQEISQTAGQAMGVLADVTDQESVAAMVKRVSDEWGSLDVLVNNAGIPVIADPHAAFPLSAIGLGEELAGGGRDVLGVGDHGDARVVHEDVQDGYAPPKCS